MIFFKLFWVFSYIGLLNFGGGYAMLSFIQQEVVTKEQWVSQAEFTDMVAISQMTPGPIGINCATYVGYTSVLNDPWVQSLNDAPDCNIVQQHLPHLLAILGSFLATLSVIWLPFIVMILVSKLILKYKNSIVTQSIFQVLRPAIIGLLASAALGLMNTENFGTYSEAPIQFFLSIAIAAIVFYGVFFRKWNIIYTILCCGLFGIIAYGGAWV